MPEKDIKFVFFGTPQISVEILEILKKENLIPSLVVTAPDKPKGRGMKVSPPPVKIWAEENDIPVVQPEKIDSEFIQTLNSSGYTLFVVIAYGKILSKEILEIPEKGVLNLHYSLLPKLRGPAPVETAIVENINPTGVTVMLMDEKMDHGPILKQKEVYFENWPAPKEKIFQKLNEVGGNLLTKTVVDLVNGKIQPKEQNHSEATYTEKIKKKDGLISSEDDPKLNFRKFLAYQPWPGIYFLRNGKRIKITEAQFENGRFLIKKIIPENGKEQIY